MKGEGRCRVLPFEVGDGPANMAIDEALLDEVAGGEAPAVVRTYGWAAPTLSLGYFQGVAEAEADPRWRGAPIVRRPTGGGAIWHDREVTYAVVVPVGHPLARRADDLYHALHAAIADLLIARGVEAKRRGASPGPFVPGRPFLCFTDRNAEDIVSRGTKVVGSAQRRRRGAVLQHGSVLLAGSEVTPELPGVGDLAGVATDPRSWSGPLLACLAEALGLDAQPCELSGPARRRAEVLRREVYGDPSWTRRR